MLNFDTAGLFRAFGGPAGLLKEIDRWQPGLPLNYGQVAMWSGRRVPTKWMPTIIHILEKTGHSCSEFLIDDDELGLMLPPPPPLPRGTGKGRNAR